MSEFNFEACFVDSWVAIHWLHEVNNFYCLSLPYLPCLSLITAFSSQLSKHYFFKHMVREMFGRGSARSGNCPVGEVSVEEVSFGEVSVGDPSSGTVQIPDKGLGTLLLIYNLFFRIFNETTLVRLYVETERVVLQNTPFLYYRWNHLPINIQLFWKSIY